MVAATPAGFDVPTETVSDAPSEDPAPATEPTLEEQFLAMAAAPDGWADGSGLKAKLAELEKQYDSGQDPAAVKALLHGSWKLVSSTDASVSLTGSAPKSYTKTLGHVQSFRKPDPMDVFSGNKDKLFFMETTEVVANEKVGSSLTACIKGGFEVKPAGAVAEAYTAREVEGLSQEGPFASYNRWTCAYLSEAVRVCRLASGAVRVYEKVDATAAKAEVSRLASALVTIDPEAGATSLWRRRRSTTTPTSRRGRSGSTSWTARSAPRTARRLSTTGPVASVRPRAGLLSRVVGAGDLSRPSGTARCREFPGTASHRHWGLGRTHSSTAPWW